MRVDHVTAHVIRIPLKTPFRISVGEIRAKNGVIFACHGEGLTGWGEAAVDLVPFYAHETCGSVMDIARQVIAPHIKRRDWPSPEEFVRSLDGTRGNHFAKAAFEAALWDLFGKAAGQSVASMLGGTRSVIENGPSIGVKDSPAATVDAVREQLDQGGRRIKLKVCPGRDLDSLLAVRKAFPDILLMVDANNAYQPEDFEHLARFDAYNLLMLEQPLDERDLYFHSLLRKRVKTPVCLDESIHTLHDLRCAVELQACDIVNIKVCRVGGLTNAKRMHDFCRTHGIANWIGSRIGTGVANGPRIAAAALPNCSLPTDAAFDSLYMSDDIVEPHWRIHDGHLLDVPKTPGMGFDVLKDKLSRYQVHQETL